MDFNTFNSRAAAEAGADLIIRHPVTGEEIADDNGPSIVVLRGSESKSVQAAIKAARNRRMGEETPEEAARTLEDLHYDMVEAAIPFIMGFKNVSLGGRALTADDAREFLDLNMLNGETDDAGKVKGLSFVEQVLSHVGKRGSFFPKQVTAPSSTSVSSAGSKQSAKR